MSYIELIATGGTIQNTAAGRLGPDELWAQIAAAAPGLVRDLPEVRVRELFREGSEVFGPEHWCELSRAAQSAVDRADVAALVVTHGTFTVEESAYYLHLTVRTTKPIVIVCSQRKHGDLGNDGDRNLVDGVRVAAVAGASEQGVLVVVGEEVHSAREVTKTNQRPGGFSSGRLGLLGSVESDQVTLYRSPRRRHTFRSEFAPGSPLVPRVDVVSTYAGADGAAVHALVEAGCKGLVVHGFAFNGQPYAKQRPAFEAAAAAGIPVVCVTRGGDGRVPRNELFLPFVAGDSLSAQKARILLAQALTRTNDRAEIQRIFDEY